MKKVIALALATNMAASIAATSPKDLLEKSVNGMVGYSDQVVMMVGEEIKYQTGIFEFDHMIDDFQVGVHKESLKWKVTDTPSKREVIVNGLGWGRLPCHVIEKDLKQGRLIHLSKFKDDDSVDIYLCKQKNKHMGKVTTFIWESF